MMKRRRGQGLVEFALILPILLLIILGIIEAAFLIQGYITVQHAAREAARFAVTYQPFQGQKLDGTECGYLTQRGPPFSDPAEVCNRNEDDTEYHARRVELIKREARRAATGLRIDDGHLGDTPASFEQNQDLPGFFGVLVWGYPSFLTDCDANPDQCLDHPGLEGLPVRVLVRHNVEIVDPFYRAVAEYVPVRADTQMINEGIQVGFGDAVPPDFSTSPDIDEPVVPTSTPSDGTPDETPEAPLTYYIDLSPEDATNAMPGDRAHQFVATVTDEAGQAVQVARVSFSTDEGGFSYSGVEPRYVEELTGANGQASVTLFGNRPVTATIRAWLDFDGDDAWDAGEPRDEATKTWTVSGPYIVVSDHEVYPEVDSIYIDVMDHDPTGNPYRLLWCVISGTTPSAVVQDPVNVDAGGDALDLLFQIPEDCRGQYRLETHSGSSGCGPAGLIAYSAPISVVVLPPDLSIVSFDIPDLICPRTVFTTSVVVENASPGDADQIFDVDFYVDPEYTPPQSPIGQMKQWVSGLDPYGTVVLNTLMWVDSPGEHQIWARVDTSDYVDEGQNEDNNMGVITVTAGLTVGVSADTGWRSPAADYADNIGFDNPSGAYANGGGRAYRNNNANDVSHVYRNYGFNVPENAIIDGIEVRLDWWLDQVQGSNSIRVDLSWDGGSNWTGYQIANTRLASDGNPTDVEGGTADTWGRAWIPSEFSNNNFRVRLQLQTNRTNRDFRIDWVPVRVTYTEPGECEDRDERPPWWEEDFRPPGLVECHQLLRAGGFEGNPQTVFSYWNAGEPLAFKHQSRYIAEGSMSMRLHASMGAYPGCPAYHPYLWQAVQIPTEVYTMTTMFVRGLRLVAGSGAPCSNPDSAEADDVLYLQMQDSGGGDLGAPTEIANGGAATETWGAFDVDVTDVVDVSNHPGEEVRVYFTATHDEDFDDTWFYLDALECEACTGWPIPDPIPGTASVGGEVRVLVGGFPRTLQGVDVWAYSPGGAVYHTVAIQDGTYHFYNIPSGTYTIYSEVWMGGGLRFATKTVTLGPDERDYGVHLFLL
jgi:hypothetical protein